MWGDEVARQWLIIRAIETNPRDLIAAEIVQRAETPIGTIYQDLELLQHRDQSSLSLRPRIEL